MTDRDNGEVPHSFGGDWTSVKLEVLGRYLQGYTTALSNTTYSKGYIDAFAGTGYRNASDKQPSGPNLLSPWSEEHSPQALLDGSAKIALRTEPRFDGYVFIERDAQRCKALEMLKEEFPSLKRNILVRQGEANEEVRKLCGMNWTNRRAVLFLDPYGMQVEWETVEAVARTRAIDLWLLFPLGIAVNRLLTRSGKIPEAWRHRLDVLLGSKDWYDEFYSTRVSKDLFGNVHESVVKATMDVIGRYFIDRLKSVFVGVAENPGVLRNSANNPLYLLCFAIGNQRGREIGLGIANHLLRNLH